MDAAQSAVILSAVAAVLQIPSPFATEHDSPQRCRFDLRPLGLCCFVAFNSHIAARTKFGCSARGALEVHQFEHGVRHVHASATPHHTESAAPAPIAHPVAAEALPLIAVLWDLPAIPRPT